MLKTIQKLKSDKRGYTLTELLVVLAILLMVFTLLYSLFVPMIRNYLIVEDRYIIQSDVNYVMSLFTLDVNKDSISSAYEAAIFYDEKFDRLTQFVKDSIESNTTQYIAGSEEATNVAAPSVVNELGTFTFNGTDTISFSKADENLKYTYLFGVNGYLYVLNPGESEARRVRDDYGELSTPITLYFEVSKTVNELVTSASDDIYREEEYNENQSYVSNGIRVVVDGDFKRSEKNQHHISKNFEYSLDTAFAFRNFEKENAKLNYVTDTEGNYVPANNCVAGYTKTYVETTTDGEGSAVTEDKYPNNMPTNLGSENTNYTKPANVLRYVSETTFYANRGSGNTAGFNNMYFKCGLRGAMNGSRFEAPVIDTLHSFRDQILRGSVLGDWIIDKYYNTVSPWLVENEMKSPRFTLAVRAVLIPTAKVLSYFVE